MQRSEYTWISSPDGTNDNVNQLKALARELLGTPNHLQLLDGDTDVFGLRIRPVRSSQLQIRIEAASSGCRVRIRAVASAWNVAATDASPIGTTWVIVRACSKYR
jgi:hypothetical protein